MKRAFVLFSVVLVAMLVLGGCSADNSYKAGNKTSEVSDETGNAEILSVDFSCTVNPSAGNSTDLTINIKRSEEDSQSITLSVVDDDVAYTPATGMREVLLADVDFDGDTDILVSHGRYGAQGMQRYRCLLNNGKTDAFSECKEFFNISNPVVDADKKEIKSTFRESASSHYYGKFRWINGVPTETLSITETITEDGVSSYEISDPEYSAESIETDFYNVTTDAKVIFTETP